jgi:hypothetical protein
MHCVCCMLHSNNVLRCSFLLRKSCKTFSWRFVNSNWCWSALLCFAWLGNQLKWRDTSFKNTATVIVEIWKMLNKLVLGFDRLAMPKSNACMTDAKVWRLQPVQATISCSTGLMKVLSLQSIKLGKKVLLSALSVRSPRQRYARRADLIQYGSKWYKVKSVTFCYTLRDSSHVWTLGFCKVRSIPLKWKPNTPLRKCTVAHTSFIGFMASERCCPSSGKSWMGEEFQNTYTSYY